MVTVSVVELPAKSGAVRKVVTSARELRRRTFRVWWDEGCRRWLGGQQRCGLVPGAAGITQDQLLGTGGIPPGLCLEGQFAPADCGDETSSLA